MQTKQKSQIPKLKFFLARYISSCNKFNCMKPTFSISVEHNFACYVVRASDTLHDNGKHKNAFCYVV